ncbi:NAD(P)-dependent dehydrogenase (short-subunit alcohol dehydrogenase family) [Paenibacillus phyllosphaerae]|uniref:NAD(P)-dependent dehydrogenase (Short-subunit alcohol dehydrogenase family) n=1 Tax=Paenibacillus phyllosphaerae TaxID=274593 RepID=A0A7W5AW88_9BACL|nr:NAD(P)-dependent dehydrogenase (short-subunit alcohol dehydrogenase family) [Paenibacillus phyllosphaerae]
MRIVITGASRGLGYELAVQAARKGHTVYAAVRDVEAASHRFNSLEEKLASRIELLELDVADLTSIQRFVDQLASRTEAIDGLVNNAAILLEREQGIDTVQLGEIIRSFETNLYGPIQLTQSLLPMLRKGKVPSIMNISSEAGSYAVVYGGDYPYGLSKAALTYFSEKLRKELEPQGFQVLAIHPGWMKTDMGGEAAPGDPVEAASQLVRLLERVRPLPVKHGFVNPAGDQLPI